MTATRRQIAKIHILAKQAGLEDDDYRAALEAATGMRSCKGMSYGEAAAAIRHFDSRQAQGARRKAQGKTVSPEPCALSRKFEELRDRPGMATPQELRKIEAMWADIAIGDPGATLRAYLFRMCRVTDLRFLNAEGAYIVIEGIKKMIARRTGEKLYGKRSQRSFERNQRATQPKRHWR